MNGITKYGERMTLQRLTDMLQGWCHQGHAQDEVEFPLETYILNSDRIKIEKSPCEEKTVWIWIDALAEKDDE